MHRPNTDMCQFRPVPPAPPGIAGFPLVSPVARASYFMHEYSYTTPNTCTMQPPSSVLAPCPAVGYIPPRLPAVRPWKASSKTPFIPPHVAYSHPSLLPLQPDISGISLQPSSPAYQPSTSQDPPLPLPRLMSDFYPPLPDSSPSDNPLPPPPPLPSSTNLLPPVPPKPSDPEMLKNIEILVAFVVKNGPEFENIVRARQQDDPKFSFLFESATTPEAAIGLKYYTWRKQMLEFQEHRHVKQVDFVTSSSEYHLIPVLDKVMEVDFVSSSSKKETVGNIKDANPNISNAGTLSENCKNEAGNFGRMISMFPVRDNESRTVSVPPLNVENIDEHKKLSSLTPICQDHITEYVKRDCNNKRIQHTQEQNYNAENDGDVVLDEFGRLSRNDASENESKSEREQRISGNRKRYSRSPSPSRLGQKGISPSLSRQRKCRISRSSPQLKSNQTRAHPNDTNWGTRKKNRNGGGCNKTSICIHYTTGKCFRGDACNFLHPDIEAGQEARCQAGMLTSVDKQGFTTAYEPRSGGKVTIEGFNGHPDVANRFQSKNVRMQKIEQAWKSTETNLESTFVQGIMINKSTFPDLKAHEKCNATAGLSSVTSETNVVQKLGEVVNETVKSPCFTTLGAIPSYSESNLFGQQQINKLIFTHQNANTTYQPLHTGLSPYRLSKSPKYPYSNLAYQPLHTECSPYPLSRGPKYPDNDILSGPSVLNPLYSSNNMYSPNPLNTFSSHGTPLEFMQRSSPDQLQNLHSSESVQLISNLQPSCSMRTPLESSTYPLSSDRLQSVYTPHDSMSLTGTYQEEKEQILCYSYPLTTIPPLPDVLKFAGGRLTGEQYDPLSDVLDLASSDVSKTMSNAQAEDNVSGGFRSLQDLIPAEVATDKPELDSANVNNMPINAGRVQNVTPPTDWSPGEPGSRTQVGENEVKCKTKSKSSARGLKLLRSSVADRVKKLLKPTWREGHTSKEVFKTIVRKAVEKVTGNIPSHHIPKSLQKVDRFMAASNPKITKLVQGYVDKYLSL